MGGEARCTSLGSRQHMFEQSVGENPVDGCGWWGLTMQAPSMQHGVAHDHALVAAVGCCTKTIVFDGIVFSGKSTQIKNLTKYLSRQKKPALSHTLSHAPRPSSSPRLLSHPPHLTTCPWRLLCRRPSSTRVQVGAARWRGMSSPSAASSRSGLRWAPSAARTRAAAANWRGVLLPEGPGLGGGGGQGCRVNGKGAKGREGSICGMA